LEGARALGADSRGIKQADAGLFLADTVKKYMYDLGCPDGLSAMGFDSSDVDQLVTVILIEFECNDSKLRVHYRKKE
jgi:hydroxyacid-oxoacid transhydrogenase